MNPGGNESQSRIPSPAINSNLCDFLPNVFSFSFSFGFLSWSSFHPLTGGVDLESNYFPDGTVPDGVDGVLARARDVRRGELDPKERLYNGSRRTNYSGEVSYC